MTSDLAKDVLKVAIISLLIALPVRIFVLGSFSVDGNSMSSSYMNGDRILLDQVSYKFSSPSRGDVIVFRYENSKPDIIKRVIGLPGETLLIEDNKVYIKKDAHSEPELLPELYLEESAKERTGDGLEKELGENEYFVMGDNRGASLDSRLRGAVEEGWIRGKTLVKFWPIW